AKNLTSFTNSQVGITGLSPQIDQLTFLSITNQFVIGANPIFGLNLEENQYQLADQLSWSHGKHNFRMGVELPQNRMTTSLPSIELGQPTFPTFADFLIGRGSCAAFTGSGTCSATNPGATNGSSFSNLSAIGNNLSARAFNGQLEQTFRVNEVS